MNTDIHNLFLVAACTGLLAMPAMVQAQLNYQDNGNGTATITGYTGGGAVVIPDTTNGLSVTSIGNFAFQNSSLTSITISTNVTSIGSLAFVNCSSLTSMTLPTSVINLGSDVFNHCSSLTNMTILGNIPSLGDFMFYNCSSLASVSLPARLTSIGQYAFNNCVNLTSITIPSHVASIGNQAFSSDISLTNVTMLGGVTSIGDWAFASCNNLANVTLPNSLISIGNYAFAGFNALASLTIPTNVTSIGDYAFDASPNLTTIAIPASVTHIGDQAFGQDLQLTAITVDPNNPFFISVNGVLFDHGQTTLMHAPARGIFGNYLVPASVTNIANAAFQQCGFLTGVTLPAGLTSIGYQAFSGCNNFGFTNVTIPAHVTSIGSYAFLSCNYLTKVYCLGNAPSADSTVFTPPNNSVIVYYLPGTFGWGATFGGAPTWNPQAPASDAAFGIRTNRFGFNITGNNNLVVVVEVCTNLANPVWAPMATNTLAGGSSYFSDSQWTNSHSRFYRFRSQ